MEQIGGEPQTTNNRMELRPSSRACETLKQPTSVELLTDSVYVGKGLSEWMPKWKANGWRRRENGKLEGRQERRPLAAARRADRTSTRSSYTRVAGHSGHPENDRCDELAVAAYQQYL